MQFDAIYDNGRLELTRPVRFASRRFAVRVEVPDREVIQGGPEAQRPGLSVQAGEWLSRLEALRAEVLSTPEADLAPVADRDRLEAIALRDDR